jgi:DNA mismatch repair protein MutL
MRHPYFHSAVTKAYENLIPVGEHVSYFIYFSVEPSAIDVNVHPTKTEIKFDNEQPIWQVLSATVKETLGRFCNVPMIDFDVEGRPDIPVMGTGTSVPQQFKLSAPSYNPFKKDGSGGYARSAGWEKLFEKYSGLSADDAFSMDGHPESTDAVDIHKEPPTDVCEELHVQGSIWNENAGNTSPAFDFGPQAPKFQYKGRYIVLPHEQGLMVVNQHRAHVCVLYYQNMFLMKFRNCPSQKELFPSVLRFDPLDAQILEMLMEDISSLGFELSNLGGGSYSLTGVPSGLEGLDADALLHEMIASAKERSSNIRVEAQEALAQTMAECSAIAYGQVLSAVEMERLLQDLFNTPTPARTPDGKTVYCLVENSWIDEHF